MYIKITKVMTNIILVILICITLLLGYCFVQTNIMKKDYVNIGGYSFFEVISGSMSPTINVGDIIIVKLNDYFEQNDIIIYKSENSMITHRVISIEKNKIITKGDSNNTEDSLIEKQDVIGKVIQIIPKVGTIKSILMTPQVILGILLIIIAIIVIKKVWRKQD